MKRNYLERNFVIVATIAFVMLIMFTYNTYADSSDTAAPAASSDVVTASGRTDLTDIKAIKNALAERNVVTLKEGDTFYLATPIHLMSNKTIIATGATIIAPNEIFVSDLDKDNYSNVCNVTIIGGRWCHSTDEGYNRTSIGFVHGSNIVMQDMVINHTNYNGHAIEVVACKDVTIDNVSIEPMGRPKQSLETMVQIDIATDASFPRLKGTRLSNGATCKNVMIQNCNIEGNRAIATGYDHKKQGFINRAHENINIVNNVITSYNAEGIFLANARTANVRGNVITTYCKKYSKDKSIGLHYLLEGKIKNASFIAIGNTIRGGKNAIRAYSMTSKKIKKVTITNNTNYCKKGKKQAVQANKKGIRKLKLKGNKNYKWK